MVSSLSTQSPCLFPFADYCSESYDAGRKGFIDAAKQNKDVKLLESIQISAKGFNKEDLFIDIAWLGSEIPIKVIFHFSGTHGVEGHAGSAIQRSLLEQPFDLDSETAIIFIHALNPYGMACNRRVNENNVDLNRNFTEERKTHPLYIRLNNLLNPEHHHMVDFFHIRLAANVAYYGWDNMKATLTTGQYDYPEGLFYGGDKIQEGPKLVFDWVEKHLRDVDLKETRFMVIDVHTGLGPWAYDTLVTHKDPTESMVEVFGNRIGGGESKKNIGYKPTGELAAAMGDLIQRVSQCAQDNIFILLEEFGTVSNYDVIIAMRNEGSATRETERSGKQLSPDASERQAYLRCFYLKDRKWRHLVVERGRDLVSKSLDVLSIANERK